MIVRPMASTASPAHQRIRLGVYVDHVATVRQARCTPSPDVVAAARCAIDAGANSITVHLREDRRHIQDADVEQLVAIPDMPINLEMALIDEMLGIAERLRPRDACFVPERREELTTEGGLDVASQQSRVGEAIERMRAAGIHAALFIDPDPAQIQAAADCGAAHIEIHTGAYADATDDARRNAELDRIARAAEQAAALGLEVHAGHGLHTANVAPVAALAPVVELNIGHALIARAVFVGLAEAVDEMRRAMTHARRSADS